MAQQIELTQKRWKAMKALGVLTTLAGVPTCFLGVQNKSDDVSTVFVLGLILFGVGILMTLVARLGAWWTSG